MEQSATYSFRAPEVRSLCWRGDELVDWVGGGRSFLLDGTERRAPVRYAYRFDAATASPDGRYAVIYERFGTKALLLDNGEIVREFNRSFYCANAYEYPVALFNDPTGRAVLAHCPDAYSRIELEEVSTGQALTSSPARKPEDFFHSRLTASPNGSRLLSAGWVWHPWSMVVSFDVERALGDPALLDRGEPVKPHSGYEEGSACWLNDSCVVVGATTEDENLDGDELAPQPNLTPRSLAVYDLGKGVCVKALQLDEPPGTMWAIDNRHILSVYRHPKVIDLVAGKVVRVWTDINSGLQDSSISARAEGEAIPPPMAFDPERSRFAIANGDRITVIEFASSP